MALFCTNCAIRDHQSFDIDVAKIYQSLEEDNEIQTELCEGCRLTGLWNDGTGIIKAAHWENNKIVWKPYIIKNRKQNKLPWWMLE